ncbi:putative GPI-anchored cell surface glycoprotein [Aspergillus melleus]|uniref:putative GPI-anchored cell surface glycoprotein n=1 Tax=Aspergillus melleus TaxID=138277 RepID=UPI001E8D41E7|nr:uncharacterized protein LDX57_006232 [Aspergillus melleus]KAH8428536.1 hypothetical protein LDX57_006232 [Aspergillus melleus]
MPGKMVGRASVTQEPGSPANSLLEPSASNQNKRSSSRASRRSARFPDLQLSNTSSNPSRSYSLPTTPIHSSFEETLPSTKRRRRRGSLSSEGNRSINLSESKDLSSGLAKSFDTSQKSNLNPNSHSDKPSTEDQTSESTHSSHEITQDQYSNLDKLSKEAQASQSTDTQKSNRNRTSHSDKLSNEPQVSQSTLHSFLKKTQDRRKSLASQADLTDPNKSDSNTSSHGSSFSGRRRTRKSLPAKTNGSGNQDSKPQLTASSRASTPRSTKADRKPKSTSQQDLNTSSTVNSTPLAVSQATPAPSSNAKLGKDKPVTPGPSRGFTPINSSTRRTRKSVADLASQMHEQSTPSGDAMDIDSVPSGVGGSVKGSSRANRRPMSNTITLNVGRKALESVLPVALGTPRHSYDHEIAESVEGTPVHVYGDSFSENYDFEYTPDMYGHNFGHDGQVDGPTSPTSFATSTSTGARTSGRTRKPTVRAMESIESERRFQRKRTRTPAAKEEPTTNGNDADMVDANAKPTDGPTEKADAHQNKKRKKKHSADDGSALTQITSAPSHPTPAPSAVAHSAVSPSLPTRPPSINSTSTPAPNHSAPARPASTASSPIHSAMASYTPTPPAPKTHTPVPYAPVALTELSTERVDIVMRLISVADDVLVAHPDAQESEDDKFLEEMRNSFRQTHDLNSSGNLSGPVEPLSCEEKAEAETVTKPKAIKPKPARARAGKAKPRKAKARRAKPTKTSSAAPAGGVKAKKEEAAKGADSMHPQSLPSKLEADKDGWIYTGQTNDFGEEVVVVSTGYHWYRPNNTYGDGGLPQPPLRLKSDEQAERDRIFGFPPRMGERNLPRAFGAPFSVENIDEEKAKIRAREEARLRHIPVDRHMSTAEIRGLIEEYDSAGAPNPPTEKATRSSRKRRHVEGFGASVESPKRRSRIGGGNSEVQAGPEPAATPAGPARPNLILKMPRPAAHEAKTETKKRPSEEAGGQPGKANKRQKVHQEASGGEGQGQPTEPTRLTLSFKNKHKQQPKLKLRQPATPKQPDTSEGVAEAATPENPPQASPGHGSSSRPRRRAAAALMAEFENHAQERARRANARKKRAEGTPEEAQ